MLKREGSGKGGGGYLDHLANVAETRRNWPLIGELFLITHDKVKGEIPVIFFLRVFHYKIMVITAEIPV